MAGDTVPCAAPPRGWREPLARVGLRWVLYSLALRLFTGCVAPPSPPAEPPNLVVITADSLRPDRLALWNPQTGVRTPNLEQLAEAGTVYLNTWAVTPWTAPSIVSLFTGLYPPSHGVIHRDDTTPRDLPTLARLADIEGYRVGNFTFFSGISYFRNLGLPSAALSLEHGRETQAFRVWLNRIGHGKEPFFAWIHLLEPHLPYGSSGYQATRVQIPGSSGLERSQLQATVPVGSVEFGTEDRKALLALYDSDVSRLDRAVGRILKGLEKRGLRDRTVILFVADHGEELLEHGWVGHASTAIEAKMVPEVLRIPLILAGPEVPARERSQALVQHVDLLPTLTALLGWPTPPHLDGIDLLASNRKHTGLRRLLGKKASAPRTWAFFDSSSGGNLTPLGRRGERLQGVSNGQCLLVVESRPGEAVRSHVTPLGQTDQCDEQGLEEALARWQRRQGEKRLAILGEIQSQNRSEVGPPTAREIATYTESLAILAPEPDATLDWRLRSGQVTVEWQGEESLYWVEYDVGSGVLGVRGSFRVEQKRLVFGPFPQGFWNDLAGYSPFRFRVIDPLARARSPWHTFRIEGVR